MSNQWINLRGQVHAPLQALLIGASAGGVEALLSLLEDLPPDYRLPVVCLLHQPDRSDSLLADLLQRRLKLPAKEAEDKEYLSGGVVYVAPAGYHLSIETDRSFSSVVRSRGISPGHRSIFFSSPLPTPMASSWLPRCSLAPTRMARPACWRSNRLVA